jgi:transcriptional regulator with XRE-family HTH domain
MARSSESADRIKGLRLSHRRTQAEFAEILGVTQPMVSAWEGGSDEPSCEMYIKLGNLASYPGNLWFWEQASLDVGKALSVAERILKERGVPPAEGEICRIEYGLPGQTPVVEPTSSLLVPTRFVPRPLATRWFAVDEKTAGTVFNAGDAVAVEIGDQGSEDLAPLENQIVLARFAPRAETKNPDWPQGLLFGRFRIRCLSHDRLYYVASIGPMVDSGRWWPGSGEGRHLIGSWRHPGISKEPEQSSPRAKIAAQIKETDRRLREIAEEGWSRGPIRDQTKEEVQLEKKRADASNRLRDEQEREQRIAEKEAAEQAPHAVRLKAGCEILGRMVDWLAAPPEEK